MNIPQARIAELLGTTGTYVSVALSRVKAAEKKAKQKPKKS